MPDKHGRRRARAEAVDYFDEPAGFLGGLGQAATRNPVDALGLLVAAGLAGMIGINALFLQDGRPSTPSALTVPVPVPQAHPAPAPAPAPRQADALGSLLSGRQQAAAVPVQPAAQPRPVPSTSSTAASVATPTAAPTRRAAAPVAEPAPGASGEAEQGPSPRILAVQRVLAERGFGPLKADGYFGEETRAAIRRFERIVGLPQKGELTPEMLTALSKVSGKKLR